MYNADMRRTMLLDISNLAARSFYSAWPGGEPQPADSLKACFVFLQQFSDLVHQWDPLSVVVCCDSGEPCQARMEVLSCYKANRKHNPLLRACRAQCTGMAKSCLPLWVARANGYEADDLMARLAEHYAQRSMPTVIVTTDHDLLQLPEAFGDLVVIYDHLHSRVMARQAPDGVSEASWKALTGDSSDNIPSVTGPKTAAKVLAAEDGRDFEDWLDGGTTRSEKLPRRVVYERNLRLVSLIGPHALLAPPIHVQLTRHAYDPPRFRQIWQTACPKWQSGVERDPITALAAWTRVFMREEQAAAPWDA